MATYNGRLRVLHIVTKLQTSCCTMFGTKHCAVCLVQTNGKLFDTNLVGVVLTYTVGELGPL